MAAEAGFAPLEAWIQGELAASQASRTAVVIDEVRMALAGVRAVLQAKLDLWRAEAQNTTGGRTLTYTEPVGGGDGPKRGTAVQLLQRPGLERWEEFTCLNSLREVEPTVKLIMDDGGLDEVTEAPPEPPAEKPATEGGAA